ncbi:MAG TPA: dTDP-4-dehydrorhamnose 3,5-epimerase, partial [Acidimicrobiales bacterium]|nr:dTDP-4-dehydrorhamnose 3,5-epimerase [Acidimicrobiales bacterium]
MMPDMSVVPFDARPSDIDGLWIIQTRQISDERGTVREFYRRSAFEEAGLPSLGPWVQVNLTRSRQGALRGLHGEDMYKLVGIAAGEAFGAYVDARADSPTAGNLVTVALLAGTQVLVPRGVCNGFQSVSEGGTEYLYCFDQEWVPGMAGSAVNPLDPALGIPWPLPVDPADRAQVSEKDNGLPTLAEALAKG